MTAASIEIARHPDQVKSILQSALSAHVDELFAAVAADAGSRELEVGVWRAVLELAQILLAALLGAACLRETAREAPSHEPLRLRLEKDYWIRSVTTFGPIDVPLYAYRSGNRTRAPAREVVFPLHPRCRSSALCVEWEARLGCALPFGQAEEALQFFSHGAVEVEDTTIARHLVAVGSCIERQWLYRTRAEIREILDERATRDGKTGRPLLYVSTDAHALRRYVDASWHAPWKMMNGIRLWAIDRRTGKTIHLGGEYTWGDCREVAEVFRDLAQEGYLPAGGDYGEGVAAQVVFISDGIDWIRDHVLPHLPANTVIILDFYHVMEHLGEYAAVRFGRGTPAAKAWYSRAKAELMGKRGYRRKRATDRRGHKKRKRKPKEIGTVHLPKNPFGTADAFVSALLDEDTSSPGSEALDSLMGYLANNLDRMEYPSYRSRGMQIGSGAMESLHRVASQMRLKIAGARWLPETALAVVNLRMTLLAGRWAAYWSGPSATERLRHAFHPPTTLSAAA